MLTATANSAYTLDVHCCRTQRQPITLFTCMHVLQLAARQRGTAAVSCTRFCIVANLLLWQLLLRQPLHSLLLLAHLLLLCLLTRWVASCPAAATAHSAPHCSTRSTKKQQQQRHAAGGKISTMSSCSVSEHTRQQPLQILNSAPHHSETHRTPTHWAPHNLFENSHNKAHALTNSQACLRLAALPGNAVPPGPA
jgi:hypothetical protein